MRLHNTSISELIKQLEIEEKIEKGKDLKSIIESLRFNKYLCYVLTFAIEFLVLSSVCFFLPRVLFKTEFHMLSYKQLAVMAFFVTLFFITTFNRLNAYFDRLLLKRTVKKVKYLKKKWE